MLIPINGPGDPCSFHLVAKQAKIPGTVFALGLEVSDTHLTCRIIDSTKQSQLRSASFEPVVAAAINLQQHTFLRTAFAARAVLWSTTLLR